MEPKKIVIIGAGQIGSRHLQGTLRVKYPLDIFVIDPFESSLVTAKERASEVEPNGHKVYYKTDMSGLPGNIDVAIIATSSNVRESVIRTLVETVQLKYLILEKILFQSAAAYKEIPTLLKEKQITTWVNLPMRTYEHFRELKSVLGLLDERISFNIVGSNWRIGCNAIHYIDLFEYIAGSKIDQLKADWLDSEIVPSKREGFVEFTGTLKGIANNKSTLMINSFPGEFGDATIYISTPSHRFIIQEGINGVIHHLEKESGFNTVSKNYSPVYQSTLTGDYITDIFDSGNCNLSKLDENANTHKLYIEEFLSFYNTTNKSASVLCPIT
jgi:hypothetical protein